MITLAVVFQYEGEDAERVVESIAGIRTKDELKANRSHLRKKYQGSKAKIEEHGELEED